jgi:predicted outer membrane repeat protein
MRSKYRMWLTGFFLTASALLLLLPTSALAQPIMWYVNGVNGNDSNNCQTAETACKTIGHAISLALSGDSIIVAPATYTENLSISISLRILGAGANTTIIDGGAKASVVNISQGNVTLYGITIRNGAARYGGGISNGGNLLVIASTISGNKATIRFCLHNQICTALGGGIYNSNSLTIGSSAIVGNSVEGLPSSDCWISEHCLTYGGGIFNQGMMIMSNSTVANNLSYSGSGSAYGGGIFNQASAVISNGTVSGNSATRYGGGIYTSGSTTLQNSVVADSSYGNCYGTMISNGYNLSSDNSCNFNGRGDLNNTNPNLGALGYYGGTTQTIPLISGSPAIDTGNPSGCTDGKGNLLKTDQRGMPRPDKEDQGGCDIGAFESQSD